MRRAACRLGRLARDPSLLSRRKPQTKRHYVPDFSAAGSFRLRLERDVPLLVVLIGIVCLMAASAAAAPAPAVFRLSISGTAHQEWDHTAAPTPAGDCMRTVRSEGIRDVRLHTARPALIRVAAARVLRVDVRRLSGTVSLSGANTISDACGTERRETIQDCVMTKRSFKGGSLGLLSRKAGSITLLPARNVHLRNVTCPREPADVAAAPLGPVPGPLRVSTATLANRRIARITLTASASRRRTYGAPEAGRIEQRSVWTLTFTRVQP